MTQITVDQAIQVLSEEMKRYPDYARTWHCNIAMAAQDAGAPHEQSNKAAADFMYRCFGVVGYLEIYK